MEDSRCTWHDIKVCHSAIVVNPRGHPLLVYAPRDCKRAHDEIALLEILDGAAYLVHLADELVAKHKVVVRYWLEAVVYRRLWTQRPSLLSAA